MTVGNIEKKTWLTPLLCALVFAAGIVPHLQNVNDPFLADDWTHLIASQHFSLGQLATLSWPSKSEFLFRPLAAVYFWANYALFGLDASYQRIVKLACYALCGASLFYFLAIATRNRVFATASSLIFMVHPMNTSAAVWLSTHANCLAVLFALLALILFVKARQHVKGRWALYGAFLLSMLLSFCSMEMVYGLPLIVVATDVLLLGPNEGRRRKLKELLRWHMPYVFVAGAFYAFRFHIGMPRYLSQHAETRTFGELLLTPLTTTPQLFVTPDGKAALLQSGLIYPAIALLFVCLLAATIITKKKQGLYLTLFALAWYLATTVPVIRIIPWRIPTPMADMRHLFAMSAGLGMLAGVSLLCLTGESFRQTLLPLALGGIIVGLGITSINVGKHWIAVLRISQALVDQPAQTCRGETYPFRILFLNYPQSLFGEITNEAPETLVAMAVTHAFKYDGRYLLKTAYTAFEPTTYDDKELKELLRYYPIQLSGQYERNGEMIYDYPQIAIIHKEDLPRTYFFYWDAAAGKCRDCTTEMRERIGLDRKAAPVEWHYADPLGKMVRPKLCNAWKRDGLLYAAPDPAVPYPAHIIVDLSDNPPDSEEYDQLVLRVSFASKSPEQGSCTIKVAWLYDDENETADVLERYEELRMYYYTYHTLRTLRFPLAQWWAREKGRHIKKLYILIPPNVTETAIESISLTRFLIE